MQMSLMILLIKITHIISLAANGDTLTKRNQLK